MKLKKTIAGAAAAAAVMAASVLVAVPALAQDDAVDDTTDEATNEARHHHRGVTKFTAVAEVLGIDLDDLRTRLGNDETIADIAVTEGVPVDDVVAALMGQAEERLADAVADDRLTQDEADERLVDIEERITGFVNGEIELGRPGFGGPRGFGPGLDAITELLGLDVADITAQLREGATLAEIAEEQGVAVDDLTAAMIAPVTEHLADHVADGDLTQDEADDRLAEITEHIEGAVTGDLPLGGRGFGERGFGPRSGGFGAGGGPAGNTTTGG